MRHLLFLVLAAAAAGACTPAPASESARALAGASTRQLLPWGSGPAEVGLRPAAPERLAAGPAAVALAADGAPLVLDRFNRRVLRLEPSGRPPRVLADAPEDAEDLAAAADGTLALYSPWRARVVVHAAGAPDGAAPVALAVPRRLREVRGVALGRSRQVLLDTAYQETFSLGSPAAPQSELAIFGQKREGAALLDDGRGVAVRLLPDRRPEVLLRRAGERLDAAARFTLPEPVLAARVVGVAGRAVCLRLEQAAAGPGFTVTRQVVCHDVDSGARLLRRDLPAPGVYLPGRELAVGGTPARVALLHATAAGLVVETVPLPTKPGEVTR